MYTNIPRRSFNASGRPGLRSAQPFAGYQAVNTFSGSTFTKSEFAVEDSEYDEEEDESDEETDLKQKSIQKFIFSKRSMPLKRTAVPFGLLSRAFAAERERTAPRILLNIEFFGRDFPMLEARVYDPDTEEKPVVSSGDSCDKGGCRVPLQFYGGMCLYENNDGTVIGEKNTANPDGCLCDKRFVPYSDSFHENRNWADLIEEFENITF
ncbi:hypothetical protein AB5N19_03591 [Seiridium cardinale]|uniref:Uncharacterized protein n=1 Tax=Seiridium cardinale TaxID=138064 RepID=A0ABR2Y2W5_9PEZI